MGVITVPGLLSAKHPTTRTTRTKTLVPALPSPHLEPPHLESRAQVHGPDQNTVRPHLLLARAHAASLTSGLEPGRKSPRNRA